jgi:hypothetical protein
MVGIAWLGGRWVPFDRLLESVIQFGLGVLVLVAVLVLLPRLISRLETLAAPADGSTRVTASDQRSD